MANSPDNSRGLKRPWPFPDDLGPLSAPWSPSFIQHSAVEADDSHHSCSEFNSSPGWNPGRVNEVVEHPQSTSRVDLEAEYSNEDNFDPHLVSTIAAPESLQLATFPNIFNDQSNAGFDYWYHDPLQLHETSSCLEDLAPNVCFGAICNVSVRISHSPDVKYPSTTLSPAKLSQEMLYFQVVKRNNVYTIVQDDDPVGIGVLDERMGKALRELDLIGGVTYEAVSEVDNFQKFIRSYHKKDRKPHIMEWIVEVNIYGPQSSKNPVGKILGLARLHLQTPWAVSRDIAVVNPHLIAFPNLPSNSSLIQLPTPSPAPNSSSRVMADGLLELLDELDQHERFQAGGDARRPEIDARVANKLLDHQCVGVMFQLEREATEPSSSFSLWQTSDSFNGVFRHVITGKRTAAPHSDSPGGIIADEMGLGKTLTMLATILTTLDGSKAFSCTKDVSRDSRTALTHCGGTLVVAPSAMLLDGWISEVEQRHIGTGILRMHKYHGSQKLNDRAKLAGFDIVLTTYHTLVAELSRNDGHLQHIDWYRVVLDEAHNIRNTSTKFFKAAAALSARRRWCLTGTPIQNRLGDIGALVQFLRVPSLSTASEFRKFIMQPIESGQSNGIDRLRTLLKSLCIRRTKDLLHLVEPVPVEHELHFSKAERAYYLQISRAHRKAIDDAVCGRKPADAYRTVFQVMLKLRMLCNHGTFNVEGPRSAEESEEMLALFQTGTATCAYCREDVDADGPAEGCVAGRLEACSHIVCGACMHRYREDLERLCEGFDVACPLCETPLQIENTQRLGFHSQALSSPKGTGVSTKLFKLLDDIKLHRHSDKCIVFSCWKKTLTVTAELLSRHGIPFVQVDGSLSLSARREALSRFENDPGTSVLLMTLGTGAVGLNLTIATRIHIIEPQWNPSIESQAIGRAVRLGQAKQVTIVRYVVQKTVEQYIQDMQARKIQLAELGFDNALEGIDEERLEKLKELCQYLDP